MKHINLSYILTFFLLLGWITPLDAHMHTADSLQIQVLQQPLDTYQELQKDGEMQYPTKSGGDQTGLLGMLVASLIAIYQWILGLFQAGLRDSDNIINFFYLVGTLAVLLVLIILFRSKATWLFGLKNNSEGSLEVHGKVDIHKIDYEAEINKAVKEGEFRIAIRLQYLQALKAMADADIIHWREGKTDHDYLFEIDNQQLKSSFEKLSFHFNYVWYGHFEASEQTYLQIRENYESIIQIKKAS